MEGKSNVSQRECDVLVVGSGVAGLAAAVEAVRAGATVLVLEGESRIGGASVMSGAACCIVGTPEQEDAGVTDSVELALADWLSFGGPTVDVDWARKYLANSREDVYDWCRELGITWSAPVRQEGNSVARWHIPDRFGVGIVEALLEELRRYSAEVLTDVPVSALLEEGSRVVGVVAGTAADQIEVRAAATVVATGGFANNRDMLLGSSRRLRGLPRFLNGGSPTARGTGHRLVEGAGGALSHMENVWIYPNATPDPQDAAGERGLGIRGVVTELWFNLNGRRFHDESLRGGWSGTNALLEQPEQTCWNIFDGASAGDLLLIDNEYFASPAGPQPEAMAEFWAQSAHAVTASDVEELAAKTGLPLDNLATEIASFNAAVRAGRTVDPTTGRALEGLSEVGNGGFAALRMFPMAQKNFGGIRTSINCEVLRPDGRLIPGLFAAGEVAGMAGGSINGAAGLEGTMFGPSLYSGRVAGITASALNARS